MLRETPAHERMEHWVTDMLALAQRKPREYPTLEQAMARMHEANPHLSQELAHHLTIYGVRRNENGTFSWKYDNYTRATSPYLFNLKDAMEIWSRVRAPTLLVRGDASWAGDWERDGRLDAFRSAELVTIPSAGHWVHHDQLAQFLQVVHRFLKI
jgi:pimeloyl-ACP methyl ester carboxylesterase